MSIIADKGREEPVCAILRKSTNILEHQINYGDFSIVMDDVIRVVFERKTLIDLAATIKSPQRKANHQKLLKLRDDINCVIIYIIEGPLYPSPNRKFGRISYHSLLSYLDHIVIRDNCQVIRSKNIQDTADIILRMSKNIMTIKFDKTGGSDKSPLETLKTKADVSIDVLVQKLWITIKGISNKSYDALRGKITFRELLTNDVADLIQRMKDLHIRNPQGIITSARSIETHIRMLTTINGVTKNTAQSILKSHSLIQLLDATEDAIAEIPKSSKLNIGPVVASRIIKIISYEPVA